MPAPCLSLNSLKRSDGDPRPPPPRRVQRDALANPIGTGKWLHSLNLRGNFYMAHFPRLDGAVWLI